MDENLIKETLPKRHKSSHKGTYGHVLNIAGSGFYSGAAYFSSIAPLKVGAGRVTLASVKSVITAVSAMAPEVILLPLEESKFSSISPENLPVLKDKISDYDVISIGCGLSFDEEVLEFFQNFLSFFNELKTPLVIDADGLNLLAKKEGLKLPQYTVLTPHPKELSRLMGVDVQVILDDTKSWALKCAQKYNSVVVLKTSETIVASQCGDIYQNKTGNSALAKGGSGDLLTGMLAGFLAQGVSVFDASCLAVYLHGLTGELASVDLTEYCVLASDLLDYIPSAIKSII